MADAFTTRVIEQLTASSQELYAAPTAPATKAAVVHGVAVNTSSAAVTFTVTVTRSGSTAATYISARTIPPGKSDFMPEIVGRRFNSGTTIDALASVASAINLSISILESTN